MSAATPRCLRAAEGVGLATLLLASAACGPASSPYREASGDDGARWAVVQMYLDQQEAWETEAGDVREILFGGGAGSLDEKVRRMEEAHGELPDATSAIAAAREIVAAGGRYTVEAAEFLIERDRGPLGMLNRERRLEEAAAEVGSAEAVETLGAADDRTWEALTAHLGPDWAIVQDFLDELEAWFARLRAREDGASPSPTLSERPSAVRAVAAARAIIDAGNGQEQLVEAAQFLVDHAIGVPRNDQHFAAAARALATHAPDYENWPRVLGNLDMARGMGAKPSLDRFFAEMTSGADSPVVRATVRYYLAAGLMREVNALTLSSEDRAARRQRALEEATGLSAGVEDEPFDDPSRRTGDGVLAPRSFAQAEADLIASIQHATVGGALPEWTGRRLDGMEEPLSSYGGRVLLIDFWATWCPPCIDALPDLRQLVSDLPADRFALLATSVDAEVATVTEFMKKEPMPWYNWHVGVSSDIVRMLDVRGFPTYLLVDAGGTILFKGNAPVAQLSCMAERAVAGEDPDCSPAEWLGAP